MPDAGTRGVNHYRDQMSPWRFRLREYFRQYIRSETKTLAKIQTSVRRPWLDHYFALSANLGSHTFYMIILPICFWAGHAEVGDDLLWVLALGVYITGVVKDLLCLPRPLCPPLHRISMSGSAALEYGLPSTHACNAVSVALVMAAGQSNWKTYVGSFWLLGTLIPGRIYNGMHGFLDVGVGTFCGVIVWLLRKAITKVVDQNISNGGWSAVGVVLVLFMLVSIAIWTHPEPIDDCPCFDDSIAFLGVLLGFHCSKVTQYYLYGNTAPPWDYEKSGHIGFILRILIGVSLVVIWRMLAKRFLLKALPPIWRKIEKTRISHPRRGFVSASNYAQIPEDIPDETVPDSLKQIKSMICEVRKHHALSDSVGAQTEADAFEALARREEIAGSENEETSVIKATGSTALPRRARTLATTLKAGKELDVVAIDSNQIRRPRPRYDVEVVTKLVVYGGIPMIAIPLCTFVFSFLGV